MTAEPTIAIDVTGHIVRTPGVVGGKPRIAGSRIRVMDVVVWYELQGQSVAEILDDFPQLTAADVHAALAYYHDNRDEIDAAFDRDERSVEEFAAQNPDLVLRVPGE